MAAGSWTNWLFLIVLIVTSFGCLSFTVCNDAVYVCARVCVCMPTCKRVIVLPAQNISVSGIWVSSTSVS